MAPATALYDEFLQAKRAVMCREPVGRRESNAYEAKSHIASRGPAAARPRRQYAVAGRLQPARGYEEAPVGKDPGYQRSVGGLGTGHARSAGARARTLAQHRLDDLKRK